ncbi:MAG: SAM-dependent methyltransferase [Pyrinomonadaceae bacterium]
MPSGLHDHLSEKLAAQLRKRITRDGPIPFSEFMAAALYEPDLGYYQRSDLVRWGRAGDYRTAPESSALFGATWARYFAGCYRQIGAPPSWTIVEAGAGAGDFAATCLAALRSDHPEVFQATTYLVDEISDASVLRSKERLRSFGDTVTFGRIHDLPADSLTGIVFANELLDAFPVTRVTEQGGIPGELCVALDQLDEFFWRFKPGIKPEIGAYLETLDIELAEGQIADVCLGAAEWWARAATVLKRGYLIAVDYGAEAADLYSAELRPHGSLRAFADHQLHQDALYLPGRLDLTANVDWTTILNTGDGQGLETVYFGSLNKFLLDAGVFEVLEGSIHQADQVTKVRLGHSAREFILPGGLAESFQVLIQGR